MKAAGVQSSEGPVKEIVLGVDTHLDAHLAVALDGLGRHLGESKIPTTLRGYGQLVHWAQSFGVVRCAGVEGTGCYGAGLARYLRKAGIAVLEVERAKRRHLRREGKSDSRDAEAAAWAVLSGTYVADKGVEGVENHRRWRESYGACIIHPPKRNSKKPWSKPLRRWVAGIRQIVETVYDKLLNAFGLWRERPHEIEGLRARLAARVALHNFCIWLNDHLGRPRLKFAHLLAW